MIKKKENNTKATINGDKEGFLVTESFVDQRPSKPGAGGAFPQNFGSYFNPIQIGGWGSGTGYAPFRNFRPSYGPGIVN